jgi:hypothetical protein
MVNFIKTGTGAILPRPKGPSVCAVTPLKPYWLVVGEVAVHIQVEIEYVSVFLISIQDPADSADLALQREAQAESGVTAERGRFLLHEEEIPKLLPFERCHLLEVLIFGKRNRGVTVLVFGKTRQGSTFTGNKEFWLASHALNGRRLKGFSH